MILFRFLYLPQITTLSLPVLTKSVVVIQCITKSVTVIFLDQKLNNEIEQKNGSILTYIMYNTSVNLMFSANDFCLHVSMYSKNNKRAAGIA